MFKRNFIKLCSLKGESPSSVCKKVGITAAAFSQWDDKTIPRKITQQKIADYFGITIEELLSDEEPQKKSAPEKIENADKLFVLETQNIHMIPIFENVSAGFGVSAIDYITDYFPLFISNPHEAENTICIKVRGDSMSPKIEDGDMIQVLKQSYVDSDSIAVVMVDGENFLVKRVFLGETWIELRSENHLYKPMRFNGKDVERVSILGLVKKIIKDV